MWHNFFGRDKSRALLASALIGEITAAIETLESNPEIRLLRNVAGGANDTVGQVQEFSLPRFSVYEKNAGRITDFAEPLPHELSYFYTELNGLQDRIRYTFDRQTDSPSRQAAAAQTLVEIGKVVDAGDQLLRDLRPLVARHRPPSLIRA